MINEVKLEISQIITDAIRKTDLLISEIPEIVFSPTKNPDHGDVATPIAMMLAKVAKMPPRKIADAIVSQIDLNQNPLIRKIEIAGPGFINLFISENWLIDVVRQICELGENYGRSGHGDGKKILIEFVSANPTGPLNIVSGRSAAVGSAIANLLNFTNHSVTQEFYVNDAGGQVERLGASIDVRYRELLGEKDLEIPDGGYHGEYLIDLAKKIIDENGGDFLKLSDEDRIAKFRDLGIDRLLSEQRSTLERFGVEFDVWTSEKAIRDAKKPEEILDLFREKDLLYFADGATWFKMTEFGDDKDCVVIKSDGDLTYFVPDAAYHRDKFDRGFDILIDLLGPDHQGHIAHLRSLIEAFDYDADRFEGQIIQQVNLIDADGNRIEMSKRRGQLITLDQLIDDLSDRIGEEFAVDAARYFFLNRTNNSHLDFDMKLAVTRANSNPVFYVQYAHARCCSIFREMSDREIEFLPIEKIDLNLLNSAETLQRIKKMAEFPAIVLDSATDREPYRLTNYLYDLASEFHTFYNSNRVLDKDHSDLMQARLTLVKSVQITISNGLRLLGISAPDRM